MFSDLDFGSKSIRHRLGSAFERIQTRQRRKHDIRFLEIASTLILQQTWKPKRLQE